MVIGAVRPMTSSRSRRSVVQLYKLDLQIKFKLQMLGQPLYTHLLTPPKQARDLGSTCCNKGSKPKDYSPDLCMSDKRLPRRGNLRTSNDLSSDSDCEVQQIQKSMKRFKIDDQVSAFEQNWEVFPFQVNVTSEDKQMVIEEETEELERDTYRRPALAHKASACEMDLIEQLPRFPLYRLNSTLVGYTEPIVSQYLGDNVYIRNILKEPSTQESQGVVFHPKRSTRFENDYEILQTLGKVGTFSGSIYKCLNRLDRMAYIIKEIRINDLLEDDLYKIDLLRNQMQLYNNDSSNNFIRFYQSWSENGFTYMVYEPATFTIEETNQQMRKLTEKEIRGLLIDVGQSLQYLQTHSKSHLNLKPSNIINCRGKYKLMDMFCDRDTVITVPESEHNNKYLAPQLDYPYLVQSANLWKTDVYSLGMILVQNIIGKQSYFRNYKFQQRLSLKRSLQSLFQYSPSLVKLLMRMTSLNSNKRPTFREITGVEQLRRRQSIPQRKLSL